MNPLQERFTGLLQKFQTGYSSLDLKNEEGAIAALKSPNSVAFWFQALKIR